MTENETPEFEDVIRDAMRSEIMDLRVAMPVRVEKYNRDKQEVDVQPLIKKKYLKNNEVVKLPIIPSVPVHFQSVDRGKAFISLPIKATIPERRDPVTGEIILGDLGFVIVCDRSIDKWLSSETGKEVLPEDVRIHNMTDAIFVPGLRPFQNALNIPNGDDIFIVNDSSKIQMSPSGDIIIQGGNFTITTDPLGKIKAESLADELLLIISNLVQELIDALIVTGIGAQPFTSTTITKITAIKTRIEAMRLT